MNYIVSNWGAGVSVGLAGTPDEVETDANLAHNLFNAGFYDDLFNGRINFSSLEKFYRFLIYKHALPIMLEYSCTLKEAIKYCKPDVRKHKIIHSHFMYELNKLPSEYNTGIYNDGDFGYNFED